MTEQTYPGIIGKLIPSNGDREPLRTYRYSLNHVLTVLLKDSSSGALIAIGQFINSNLLTGWIRHGEIDYLRDKGGTFTQEEEIALNHLTREEVIWLHANELAGQRFCTDHQDQY